MSDITYKQDTATFDDIRAHFDVCDEDFVYDLSGRVSLYDYIKKILAHALRFEAWHGDKLIGLVAVYSNPEFQFVTNVSIAKEWNGKGIAKELMQRSVENVKTEMRLEVRPDNVAAIKLYRKFGFEPYKKTEKWLFMGRGK